MTADTLHKVLHSFANRSTVRFLIRQGAAELATIDPATGRTHTWSVRLRPTADGAFEVEADDESLWAFARRGLAFELTSEASAEAVAVGLLDEAGVPTEAAVQRVRSWVDLSVRDSPTLAEASRLRLTLRDARIDWRAGLGV